uniref:Uncharacterized protein n=1 Tax=Arundo donax TaxID=35708 RepID=A0A0A9FTW8_ARUDO
MDFRNVAVLLCFSEFLVILMSSSKIKLELQRRNYAYLILRGVGLGAMT